jgi:hypothetical protein
MSELTQCNFCRLKGIKERAKKSGEKVTTLKANWGLGGMNVYVHPKDVNIRKLDEEGTSRKAFWKGWLMEVGNKCEC